MVDEIFTETSSYFMARAQAMPVAGLQLCDRSKFALIETTLTHEGGFGELENLNTSAS
jgi:hypothetical protein